MTVRAHFERKLNELNDEILLMGRLVEDELKLAMEAFNELDAEKAKAVSAADRVVNRTRFDIEEKCFSLIVTQQPAARDLRAITTAMNIIVDLERMGDQAKGIAKVVPRLIATPVASHPPELALMGEMVAKMLSQVMVAFAHKNVDLARILANQDDEVDALYARVFTQIMGQMADAASADKVEASYELLRAGRELERVGDLVTNVAERIVYLETGSLEEVNVDRP